MHELFEVKESPIHGLGVFARQAFTADSFIGDYEGERTVVNGMYVLWVEYDDGEIAGIDGKNELRYLNHARPANAIFRGHSLYALMDIEAGSEITFDYGEDW
ncbi:MAG: SET domain-containing protein-lysine N-methyltransferase [Myxococcales bacterium]